MFADVLVSLSNIAGRERGQMDVRDATCMHTCNTSCIMGLCICLSLSLCIYIYIYIYIFMHTHNHIYIYIYIYTHVHTHVLLNTNSMVQRVSTI